MLFRRRFLVLFMSSLDFHSTAPPWKPFNNGDEMSSGRARRLMSHFILLSKYYSIDWSSFRKDRFLCHKSSRVDWRNLWTHGWKNLNIIQLFHQKLNWKTVLQWAKLKFFNGLFWSVDLITRVISFEEFTVKALRSWQRSYVLLQIRIIEEII